MTHHRQRSQLLLWLTGLTAVVILIAAFETTRILNGRTQDRIVSDTLTQVELEETRRIVDELLCEMIAVRTAMQAEHPEIDQDALPRTVPRARYQAAPCPPPPR